MSTISNLIFKNGKHTVTSSFGYRGVIKTSAGNTNAFHSGTDYGTYNVKLPQYAIEDGYCFASAKESDGANYVWVIYPRVKLAMLHYHLDSRNVVAGQKVSKGTLLGYTGQTGKATGIHLHLGIRDLSNATDSQVNNMTWALLRNFEYVNPEGVNYVESSATPTEKVVTYSFLPEKGYWYKGDKDERVGKICKFFYDTFPAYADVLKRKKENLLGDYYGENITAWVKEFQKRIYNGGNNPYKLTEADIDGYVGAKTLKAMRDYGFPY